MTEILIDGFWNDLSFNINAIFEEIAIIDRVINHRIRNHAMALERGHAARPRPLLDDLLHRRQLLADLAECLLIEQTWETAERIGLQTIVAKIKKNPKHPRWVG